MAFDLYLSQDKAKPRKLLRVLFTVSLAAHVVMLAALAVRGFWHVDELSPPGVTVTFLSGAPPPPPPPPPPKKKKTAIVKPKVEVVQPTPTEIVQPILQREEPKVEEEEDEGQEGGVEGGVAGGVVGGVVNAPPPPPDEPPKTLPPAVGGSQLLIDPSDAAYRVVLPPALNRAGMSFWALVKICVGVDGNVKSATLVKKADPLIDDQIVEKVSTFRYKPYSLDGRPVPFCYVLRYSIAAQ